MPDEQKRVRKEIHEFHLYDRVTGFTYHYWTIFEAFEGTHCELYQQAAIQY